MTTPVLDVDPYDARFASRATGLLGVFNRVDVLSAADVHVANRLGALADEPDEQVRLAVALAVRGVRGGSVCIDLREMARVAPDLPWPEVGSWTDRVKASPLVGPGRPLRWDLDLLYLDRYWRQEDQVRADLTVREAQLPPSVDPAVLQDSLDRHFPELTDQRLAAESAVRRWTTVLGGGPGTGKTTTVARLLAVLHDQHGPGLRIALAAPTGKAAARLQEAVQQVVATEFGAADRERLAGVTASTLHRLLGSRPGDGTRFRHDRENRLPHDIVVVDETSMLSLTLMARLLEAVRPDARLVLVGDPDQLASVEAGAVLADLVAGLTARPLPAGSVRPVVVLTHTWRFGSVIGRLAGAVRAGDADAAVAVLAAGEAPLDLDTSEERIRDDVVRAATAIRAAAKDGDARAALAQLDRHRVLCAHRAGPFGVQAWSRKIERWLADVPGDPREGEWYIGRPLLVTANDYALGLFNGDTGVVVRQADGSARAVFARGADLVDFAPSRLGDVETVHAMTVHRSQGSQFERVTVILPPADSPLATREMIYTALTRAKEHVRLVGSDVELRAAIARPAARASGLRLRLASG
ncbi:DNA helicase/exodeoxyribonuclease V, alpha subunit [Nakamurella panacisegetis]|uniref:RecBCD enzyme subunit RecD n=1 Tax=Nakamurella panacisegetis TaxID=1090615 RepID=A0A1H0KWH4_9ACTN|nr:exodeoxyribonuclease V subunit alpha [Nakamurella panacisegetis]SDO60384.1 DNA helicase/exodeoxyribonuclease V, alpha subunit [Nakamurella panacisegetis]